jgi:hypothetical protein
MADDAPPANDTVAAALTLLANAIAAMNANTAASTAAANAAALSRNTPTVDFFDNNLPFDLATRAGGEAFKQACLPLDLPWDEPSTPYQPSSSP